MEIRDLTYLVACATAGNFTRAAKSLGLNTSTVSRRIGELEDELGLALFERGRAGVRLTAGGAAVVLTAGAPLPRSTPSGVLDRATVPAAPVKSGWAFGCRRSASLFAAC